jgi:hypothetical protein
MQLIDGIGYLAAALVFASFYMKTMIPLRVLGVSSNLAFVVYGYLADAPPILILHCILLPLNIFLLRQMVIVKVVFDVS